MASDDQHNTAEGAGGQPPGSSNDRSALKRFFSQRARYPNESVWFVFVSVMDVFMTTIVLHFGGREMNLIAKAVLDNFGVRGMALFKFILVLIVLASCQIVGGTRYRTGKVLVRAAVIVTAMPMILAFAQLLMWYV